MRQKSTPAGVRRATIRVDRRSKIPAYLQITQQVRALVATGALRRGDRLPTVRQLAGEAGINFNTVARAYRILDQAGVISTQHGRGTYVLAPPPSLRARAARAQALDVLARDVLQAAARFGCGPPEVQAALERAAGHVPGPTSGRNPRRPRRRRGAPSRPR